MSTHHVLVVCEQNVCRSPYLAALLGEFLNGDPRHQFVVTSRGTMARPGTGMCAVAESQLALDGFPVTQAHEPQLLQLDDVSAADLILTATVQERSAVALLSPLARQKSFTVREALLLAELPRRDDERLGGKALSRRSSLRDIAEVLNGRRGSLDLPLPEQGKTFGFRRRVPDAPLDIPDHHRTGGSRHQRLFPEMHETASVLADRVRRAVRASDSTGSRSGA